MTGDHLDDDHISGDMGVGSWPARRARITPDRTALIHGDRSWTYAELSSRTAALAAALRGLGVRPGDRVAYLGRNHPAFLETMFATGHAGAVLVPLNIRLSPAELAYMLEDAGATVLVYGADLSGPARQALAGSTAVRHAVVVGRPDPAGVPAPGGPGPTPAPAGAGPAGATSAGDAPDGAVDYESLLTVGAGADPVRTAVTLDDHCMIIYTSGTTGRPKGAVITHGNCTWNMINQLAHVDYRGDDVALAVAPLFHTAGLNQVTLPTLFKGGAVVVLDRFDAGELLDTVGRRRITSFAAVPTILQLIADHPAWDGSDLSSLRYVIYGGSSVHERVAQAWLARGVPLLQGYGMTEASPGVVMAVAAGAPARPLSAGVPHFFTDVAVQVDGAAVPPLGRSGELLVRGPNVFTGYWQRPAESAASFLPGQWFRTGDVVRVDPDGWTYVVDRITDVIVSGGENVYPAEVEAALRTHPEIADCAVVGVPDERWGEVGVAFVVPRSDGLDTAAVTAHLTGLLARYKVPKQVRFVPELPTNAVGKVRRAELRTLARAAAPAGSGSEQGRATRRREP